MRISLLAGSSGYGKPAGKVMVLHYISSSILKIAALASSTLLNFLGGKI